jgi:gliding motility-associated protein GldL
MSKKKGGIMQLLYKTIMPKVYGIGAAVVIIGALFKILHLTGADLMLMIGLSTEAVIFFLSAFEPAHQEPDWAKVYPQLATDYEGDAVAPTPIPAGGKQGSALVAMEDMLSKAKVDQNLLDNLGKGLNNLATSATNMNKLADAVGATNEYANNVKSAAKSLSDMNKSYDVTMKAMTEMANAATDAKSYHAEVQKVTKNLAALNAAYEMELKDADNHVKNMNKFYESLSGAMQGLTKVGDNTSKFTTELGKLTDNLTSLNRVYGSMLTAMKGGGGQG